MEISTLPASPSADGASIIRSRSIACCHRQRIAASIRIDARKPPAPLRTLPCKIEIGIVAAFVALKKAGDAGDGKKARRGEQKTKGVLISSTSTIRNASRERTAGSSADNSVGLRRSPAAEDRGH
ncbi:hypothetical protein ABIA00_003335 [Bradyrhizobium ottawaense]|uniref:hypothetical protein n=1 Tax=Bradyrhizobium ottawaense TaxID=931866 RepID=UPI0038323F0B